MPWHTLRFFTGRPSSIGFVSCRSTSFPFPTAAIPAPAIAAQSDVVDSKKNTGAIAMASDDANVLPNPAHQKNPVRRCEKCAAEMKQLGELPALSIHAAIKVFRGYTCDHVVTDRVL